MMAASSCHIELFVSNSPLEDMRSWLTEAGYDVGVRSFQEPHMLVPAHLQVVDGGEQTELALKHCHRLRIEQNDSYTPILFVTGNPGSSIRLASLECGADTSLARPFQPAELLAQVHSLLRVKGRH